jgi:hypothetical protein
MKLFQIEEPDGTPLDSDGPGAAVGIAIGKSAHAPFDGAVAIAVGGNAEILPSADGERMLSQGDLAALLLALRAQAEKQLPGTKPLETAALEAAVLAEDLAPKLQP